MTVDLEKRLENVERRVDDLRVAIIKLLGERDNRLKSVEYLAKLSENLGYYQADPYSNCNVAAIKEKEREIYDILIKIFVQS